MTTNQTLWLDQGGLRVGANQLTTSGSGVGVGTSSIYGSFTAGNGAVFFGTIGIGGANYGTSGQVLTSGGASAAPSWSDQLPSRSIFTSSGTWTKPAGARLVLVRVWGAGGGGSGGDVAGAGVLKGGGFAGTGGAYFEKYFLPSALTATVTVTVGTAGTGGASATGGVAGGQSSFGAYITCGGGRGGANGVLRTGGAAQGAGTSAASLTVPSLDGSGGANAYYGGAGNSSSAAVGWSSQFGGGAGGSGGGETAANALVAPFDGGQSNYNVGGLAGTSVAGAPTVGGAGLFPGSGGGGGGSAQTANGAIGGAGGFPAGGGGGGGSTRTGFLGGAGGDGGAGYVEVYTW